MQRQDPASLQLRVSVACFRWNGETIETIVLPDGTLPSDTPHPREALDDTARHILKTFFDTPPAYIEQLYTFSYVASGSRETVVTYIALFRPGVAGTVSWTSLADLDSLPERSARVLDYATVRLRAKLEYTSIAFYLMPVTFTIAELQTAYEAILDLHLDKRNFRRRMTTSGMLKETAEMRREGPHRPARLYTYSGRADRSSYLTPLPSGAKQETTE
jgi:8-oxo-dGTP diphosphatase